MAVGPVIRDRLIICIANSWDYDPTSKHQLVRILSRYNDVVWVDYHGTRRPAASRADLWAVWQALRRVTRGVRRVAPSVVRLTPMVIPGARRGPMQRWHQQMLAAQIRRALGQVPGASSRPIQVWTFAPDVPHLAGRFGEECFVYYCVDEYTEFEGFDRRYIAESERVTLERADVIVTSSQSLWEKKRASRPDAVLVRHGVDYAHFASAWREPLTPPDELASIDGPVFGYFGLIHHWVDVELLAEVARLRPTYSFVLLGECKVNVSGLRGLPNVHLLGRRPYDALPGYCAGFSAGLMLFRRSEMTRHVNPIKMLEYLAAGLPVVSTPLAEAERFAGPIVFAETPAGFAEACDRVLTTPHADRARISAMVAGQTWHSRAEELSGIIESHLRRGARSSTAARSAAGLAALAAPSVG
jgi:glycosyltransferase involved in cell wall biosynthesis